MNGIIRLFSDEIKKKDKKVEKMKWGNTYL